MTYRVLTFPAQLARNIDPLILDARIAITDMLRAKATATLAAAESAGVDLYSAGQRLSFDWAGAIRASKFLRGFPGALARWAFKTTGDSRAVEGYPAAESGCFGVNSNRWLTSLPGNVMLVNAGGVQMTGSLPQDTTLNLREVIEVRVKRAETGYAVDLVLQTYGGGGSASDPEPALEADPEHDEAMEREDAS